MVLSMRLRQRTQSRFAMESIIFEPYNQTHILKILLSRLRAVDPNADPDGDPPLFNKQALELCARKTANVSGDIRRALHLCHLAGVFFCCLIMGVFFCFFLTLKCRLVDRIKPKLLDGTETQVSLRHMSECVMLLKSTAFATLLHNASLYEKMFLIAVAREMAATGTQG